MARHQLRIDVEKGQADILGEREIMVPVAAVMMVVENAADATMLAPVRQEEQRA